MLVAQTKNTFAVIITQLSTECVVFMLFLLYQIVKQKSEQHVKWRIYSNVSIFLHPRYLDNNRTLLFQYLWKDFPTWNQSNVTLNPSPSRSQIPICEWGILPELQMLMISSKVLVRISEVIYRIHIYIYMMIYTNQFPVIITNTHFFDSPCQYIVKLQLLLLEKGWAMQDWQDAGNVLSSAIMTLSQFSLLLQSLLLMIFYWKTDIQSS